MRSATGGRIAKRQSSVSAACWRWRWRFLVVFIGRFWFGFGLAEEREDFGKGGRFVVVVDSVANHGGDGFKIILGVLPFGIPNHCEPGRCLCDNCESLHGTFPAFLRPFHADTGGGFCYFFRGQIRFHWSFFCGLCCALFWARVQCTLTVRTLASVLYV